NLLLSPRSKLFPYTTLFRSHVLMEKYPVPIIKIGVVKNAAFLAEIVKTIKSINPKAKIIWDPVLKSTSEFSFFDLNTISELKNVDRKSTRLNSSHVKISYAV